MSEEKHYCSESVWGNYGCYNCGRLASVERDGEWYCWQHDPKYIAKMKAEETVERKRRIKAREKKNTEAMERSRCEAMERSRRIDAALAACDGLDTATLERIGEGGVQRLVEAMKAAQLQLEYVNEKQERGTTNAALAKIRAALAPFEEER